MRPIEKLSLYAGVGFAIVLGLSAHLAGTPAVALQGPAAVSPRIATIDTYIVTERLMGADDLKKARESLSNDWNLKLRGLEKEFSDIDQGLQLVTQNDPKYQDLIKRAQGKQQEYQQMLGTRDQEVEKLNSSQLIASHQRVIEIVKQLADKNGYTHVVSTRPISRPIVTTTVGATLQEMLARPVMISPAADDLTKPVLEALKLDATNLDKPSDTKSDPKPADDAAKK
jgi:Skp family chaperone for outer membrane proteins